MNVLPRGRRVGLLLLPLLAALLAGCGPTTGGTGTGDSLSAFGATAAATCTSTISSALSCPNSGVFPTSPDLLDGTLPVTFNGEAASGPWTLTLEKNRALLQSRCSGAFFEGVFGVLPDGRMRFFGHWTGAERAEPVPAQLWLQLRAGSNQELQAMVLDSAELTLFGPLPLTRSTVPTTAPASCP